MSNLANMHDAVTRPVAINDLPPQMILWGGTGQAKVVRPIIDALGSRVVAVFDDTRGLCPPFPDVELHHGREGFDRWARGRSMGSVGFCVAIGNPHGRVRVRLHEELIAAGLRAVTIAHASAIIADNAVIGAGCQFMAGAIVNPEARLGRQCIINTGAIVDHEDILEDGCELAPSATLCGLVHLEANAWVAAGATVCPRIRIGADAIVGAGAVVIADVAPRTLVVGVPARPVISKR